MAKQTINLGTPNGKDGDIIRDAFNKVNQNFNELYALTGGTAAELTELAQDYAAEMFVGGTHTGITVTYDDDNNRLNLSVPDGFSGAYADLTGTPTIPANINDLGDVALTDPVNGDLLTYFNGSWTNAALLNYVTVGSNISVLNNDAGYITSSNLTGYATELFVTSQGYLTAIPPSIVTDLTGSVFADNSTPLVDAVNGKIVGDIDTSSFTLYGRMTTADLGGGQTTFRTTETNQDGDTVASVWLQSLTTSGMQVINDPAGDSNTLYSTVEVEASAASLTSAVQTLAGDEFARVLVAPGLIQLRAGTPADGTQVWQLSSDGSIEFPDSTIQTTAWTGSVPGFTYNEGGGTSEIGVTADVFDFGNGKTIDMQNSTVLFTGSTVSGILSLNTDYITIGVGGSINMQGSDIGAAGAVSAVSISTLDLTTNTVRSEGDINISVNLTDSTTRNWAFTEGGDLVFPDGTTQSTAFTGGDNGNLNITGTVIEFAAGATQELITISPDGFAGQAILQLPRNTFANTYDALLGNTGGDVRIGAGAYDWRFGSDGNLTIPGELHGAPVMSIGPSPSQVGRTVNITPADDADDKKFRFRVDQYAGQTFTRAYLELPTAEVDKQVAAVFPHSNGKAGFIYTQGNDTNGQGMNDAFNIFYNNGDIKITSMGSSGGLYTWKFGDSGDLTIPGNIESEDAVEIRVNLTDSTTHTWRFGEDGHLNLPSGGGNIQSDGTIQLITGSSTVSVTDDVFGFLNNKNGIIAFSIVSGGVSIAASGNFAFSGDNFFATTTNNINFTSGSGITLNSPVTEVRGNDLILAGNAVDIQSEGGINIDINLSDSTLRRWSFGEDGNLNLAGYLQFPNGAEIRDVNGDLRLRAAPGDVAQLQGLTTDGAVDAAVKAFHDIETGSYVTINTNIDAGAPEHVWTFDYNGGLTIPGTINAKDTDNDTAAGSLTIRGGNNTGSDLFNSATGGNVTIQGGSSTFSLGGNVVINGGSGSTGPREVSINQGTTGGVWLGKTDGTGDDIQTYSRLQIHRGVVENYEAKADATGVVEHDCDAGHLFYHTSPDANWTVNLTNLNAYNTMSTNIVIVIEQGGTPYYPNALQIGGAAQTIKWLGNVTPTAQANKTEIATFTIFYNGSVYNVLGSYSSYG